MQTRIGFFIFSWVICFLSKSTWQIVLGAAYLYLFSYKAKDLYANRSSEGDPVRNRSMQADLQGNDNGLQENLQAVFVPEAGLEPAHFWG